MKLISMKLPELARENIKDSDNFSLKNIDTKILLDQAEEKSNQLRYSGLDKKLSINREFRK